MKDDLTLIKGLKRRDSNALAGLYDKYSPALYGVIIRICKHREMAQDLLQETFVKIWEKSDQYDPNKGRFYTWSYRIARNTTLNALRNRNDLIQKEDLSVYTIEAEKPKDDSDLMSLNGTVAQLEAHHREAINLVYFRGMTHREAHKVMDVPLGTFKSYVRQALRELRENMGGALGILALLIGLMR